MAYTATATVKTLLGISDSDDDTLIGTLLAQAQEMIDVYCARTFEASANTSRTFDSDRDVDGATLYLDEDLASINSITNGDGDVLTTSEYTTEPRNRTPYYAIRLLPSSGVYWQANSTTKDTEDAITISGKWAYSTSAPAGIVRATEELTVLLYRQRDTSSDLNRTVIAGNATILPAGLSSETVRYLNSLRKII